MQKVAFISYFLDNTRKKAELWKVVQKKRDAWEVKYYPVIKRVLDRQFKQLAERIDVTNYQNENIVNQIIEAPIRVLLTNLYKEVGTYFAKDSYNSIKLTQGKAENMDAWEEEMENYVKTRATKKIVSITESSRATAQTIIKRYLSQSTEMGWGAEETAREIRKALVKEGIAMNQWRALRIARTEIVSASNIGAMKGAESTGLPMEKFWIATYDSRTRDSHMAVEQQNPKDFDEPFKVGAYQMNQPGDDSYGAGPEEIINCRCTVAFNVKGFI